MGKKFNDLNRLKESSASFNNFKIMMVCTSYDKAQECNPLPVFVMSMIDYIFLNAVDHFVSLRRFDATIDDQYLSTAVFQLSPSHVEVPFFWFEAYRPYDLESGSQMK